MDDAHKTRPITRRDNVRSEIWRFICALELTPVEVNEPGTTWVELLLMYLIGGGNLCIKDDIHTKKVTLRMVMAEFNNVFKNIVMNAI